MFKVGVTTSLSEPILEIWRRAVDRFGSRLRQRTLEEGADELYLRARARARVADLGSAAQQFAAIAVLAPTFTPALEAHGEVLDMLGQSELARSKYDVARRLRSQIRRGTPVQQKFEDCPNALTRPCASFTASHGYGEQS